MTALKSNCRLRIRVIHKNITEPEDMTDFEVNVVVASSQVGNNLSKGTEGEEGKKGGQA
jgi:hypothetical protein